MTFSVVQLLGGPSYATTLFLMAAGLKTSCWLPAPTGCFCWLRVKSEGREKSTGAIFHIRFTFIF
ncbi:hypothetical protein LP417_00340 [Polaromonas sp. P1-6]|nr:hypothetical protein LP417_00340 [Polaromonas sp. P1-6]